MSQDGTGEPLAAPLPNSQQHREAIKTQLNRQLVQMDSRLQRLEEQQAEQLRQQKRVVELLEEVPTEESLEPELRSSQTESDQEKIEQTKPPPSSDPLVLQAPPVPNPPPPPPDPELEPPPLVAQPKKPTGLLRWL